MTSIVGPSGAGKTTITQILSRYVCVWMCVCVCVCASRTFISPPPSMTHTTNYPSPNTQKHNNLRPNTQKHIHTYTHRFYAPSAGQLLLDGQDIRKLDPEILTKEIALVGQVRHTSCGRKKRRGDGVGGAHPTPLLFCFVLSHTPHTTV
jgi:energy-coupling factor transporter ATP-binding protein EcfA2